MGLISRVSSRTYRKSKLIMLPIATKVLQPRFVLRNFHAKHTLKKPAKLPFHFEHVFSLSCTMIYATIIYQNTEFPSLPRPPSFQLPNFKLQFKHSTSKKLK